MGIQDDTVFFVKLFQEKSTVQLKGNELRCYFFSYQSTTFV